MGLLTIQNSPIHFKIPVSLTRLSRPGSTLSIYLNLTGASFPSSASSVAYSPFEAALAGFGTQLTQSIVTRSACHHRGLGSLIDRSPKWAGRSKFQILFGIGQVIQILCIRDLIWSLSPKKSYLGLQDSVWLTIRNRLVLWARFRPLAVWLTVVSSAQFQHF
jgi:hypothetical protein